VIEETAAVYLRQTHRPTRRSVQR